MKNKQLLALCLLASSVLLSAKLNLKSKKRNPIFSLAGKKASQKDMKIATNRMQQKDVKIWYDGELVIIPHDTTHRYAVLIKPYGTSSMALYAYLGKEKNKEPKFEQVQISNLMKLRGNAVKIPTNIRDKFSAWRTNNQSYNKGSVLDKAGLNAAPDDLHAAQNYMRQKIRKSYSVGELVLVETAPNFYKYGILAGEAQEGKRPVYLGTNWGGKPTIYRASINEILLLGRNKQIVSLPEDVKEAVRGTTVYTQ